MILTDFIQSFISINPVLADIILAISILVITEIIYYLFVKHNTIQKGNSEWGEAITYKIVSAILAIGGIMVIYVIAYILDVLIIFRGKILMYLGIGVAIFIYLWINKMIFSKVTNRETDKEAQKRIAKDSAWCKFKIGEKVRVRPDLENGDEFENEYDDYNVGDSQIKFRDKIVTITKIDKQQSLKIKEDDGEDYWHQDMFQKIKKKEKKGGKKK